jgi:hypothetical protein
MSAIPYGVVNLIESRLQAQLDAAILNDPVFDGVVIVRADSIERMPRNIPRALILVPNGITPDEQRRYQAVMTEQVIVVVASRNASTQLTGEASQEQAGPLLNLVVQALLGWVPGEPYSYLAMAPSPPPDHESGYGYYPLAFETTYVLSGARS